MKKIEQEQKHEARKMAQKFLNTAKPETLRRMEDEGTLVERLPVLMHEEIYPWLLDQMTQFLKVEDQAEAMVSELFEGSLKIPCEGHHENIEQEKKVKQ